MNPATTPGPQAANRQDCRLNLAACPDTCGFFASMISRGGRGLPFARLTASPHFHQDTQGRGGLVAGCPGRTTYPPQGQRPGYP